MAVLSSDAHTGWGTDYIEKNDNQTNYFMNIISLVVPGQSRLAKLSHRCVSGKHFGPRKLSLLESSICHPAQALVNHYLAMTM